MSQTQIVYHGANALFDQVDFEHIGSGEGSSLVAYGFYASTSPEVAEYYRDKCLTHTHHDARLVVVDGEIIDVNPDIAEQVIKSSYEEALSFYENDPDALEELYCLEGVDVALHHGVIYSFRVPDESELLDWNGGVYDQTFDVFDFAREYYGEEQVGDFYDEALECWAETSESQERFDEVFNQVLLAGNIVDVNLREAAEEVAPDFDWRSMIDFLADKALNIEDLGSDVGRMLYAHFTHHLGSDQAASKFFKKELGVSGLIVDNEFGGISGARNVVVWDENAITVVGRFFDLDSAKRDYQSKRKNNDFDFGF